MQVIRSVNEMQATAIGLRSEGKLIGFVPTMGYLHEGHLSLVDVAKEKADVTIVSIFVNPAQFGVGEDLGNYPRDLDHDLQVCEQRGVDFVFVPTEEKIYPEGYSTYVEESEVAKGLCGISRPTHFRGVTTISAKLFNLCRPDFLVLGQKDAQQLLVVRRLNADLNLGAEIVAVPTVRDTDGLALSSRNVYLDDREREGATVLYRSLRLSQRLWDDGLTDAVEVKRLMRDLINEEPLASIDYVSVADPETLEELDTVAPKALVSLAVRIGKTRLIDNVSL